jgi:hypothetical protein
VTTIIVNHYRVPLPISASFYFLEMAPQFLLLTAALIALRELVRLARSGLPPSPLRAIGGTIADTFMKGDRPGNIFHATVTMAPLMIAFAALKEEIPAIHPFAWDQTFLQMDLWLGHGTLPWQYLQPLLGFPPVTAALSLVYDLWFVVMFGSLFCMAYSAKRSELRMQFLIAFALCWFLVGNVFATILSSAGPCFYGNLIHGPDPFAAQMIYLREASRHWPVWSIQVQDLLWHSYATGDGAVKGISAMPSMHVTIAVLVACLGCRLGRRWAIASVLFAILIFIGSIHLGWHYAVDGIAGGGLAVLFWRTAGWAARALPSRKMEMPAVAIGESIA